MSLGGSHTEHEVLQRELHISLASDQSARYPSYVSPETNCLYRLQMMTEGIGIEPTSEDDSDGPGFKAG